jgi:hypothetical protein
VADFVLLGQDVVAGHRRATGVRPQERGKDPNGRRLAGAVRAEQAQDGPLVDGQVDAVERADLVPPGAVDLDQALGDDRRGRG